MSNPPASGALRPDAILTETAELWPRPSSDGQLFYEPLTGRLVVRADEHAADAVPATEMARTGFFADPDARGTERVLARLGDIAVEGEDDLVFDPATGRLTVRKKSETVATPDAVSAVQMARTGFFAARAGGAR